MNRHFHNFFYNIYQSGITLIPLGWYCTAPPNVTKTVLNCRGIDCTKPLKVCCGIWKADFSSRSFPYCCDMVPLWIGPIEICDIWSFEHFHEFLVMFLNNFCSVIREKAEYIIVLKEATAVTQYSCHEVVYLFSKQCLGWWYERR